MGMPLYALKDYKEEKVPDDLHEDEVMYLNGMGGKRGSMSSMSQGVDRLVRGRQGSISDVRGTGRARSRSQSRSRVAINGNRDPSATGGSKNRLNHVRPVHF